jgi:cytochrome c-type biogenesis protein CcmH
MKRWAPYLALLVVVVVALVIGTSGSDNSPTARADRIESEIRCPACNGQSVQASDAPTARAVRDLVVAQIKAGRSNGEIERDILSRYGNDLQLRPSSHGLIGLVWVIPMVALGVTVAGLTLAFRRWRAMARGHASEDDRALVRSALGDG